MLDGKASVGITAFAHEWLAKTGADLPPAAAWNAFAGGAYLRGHPDAALWAEAHALQINRLAEYVANAGVYLVSLKNLDDAKLFLHCAYDMGFRAPSLFEALALAYDRSGDKDKARQNILLAQQADPADQLIQAEVSLITTGTLPARADDDDLERAVQALERHVERVFAQIHADLDVREQIDHMLGEERADRSRQDAARQQARLQQSIASIRNLFPKARLTFEEYQQSIRTNGTQQTYDDYVAEIRNTILYTCVTDYMIATTDLLASAVETYSEGGSANMLIGARALQLDLLAYVRRARDARDIADHAGHRGGSALLSGAGFAAGDPAEASFRRTYFEAVDAGTQARKACGMTRECLRRGLLAECRIEIPAYQQYATDAQSQYQIAARGVNRAAKGFLAWGAGQVGDARFYVVTTLKHVRRRPNNRGDAMWMDMTTGAYRTLVAYASGNPATALGGTLSTNVRDAEAQFAQMRSSGETTLEHWAANLSKCQEVAKELLATVGDSSQATQQELFDRLIESLDAKYDPTLKCEFTLGPVSAHLDYNFASDELHTETHVAVWELAEGEHAETEGGEWGLSAGVTTKFDANGAPVQSEVTVGGDVSYEGVTARGEVGLVATRDPRTGKTVRRAEIKGSVGIGVEAGAAGAACFPGEVTMEFEPRDVMDRAVDYLRSVDAGGS